MSILAADKHAPPARVNPEPLRTPSNASTPLIVASGFALTSHMEMGSAYEARSTGLYDDYDDSRTPNPCMQQLPIAICPINALQQPES